MKDSRLNPISTNSTNKFKKTPGFSFSIIHPTSSMMTSDKPQDFEEEQEYSIVQLSINEIEDGDERSASPNVICKENQFRSGENNHFQTFVVGDTPQFSKPKFRGTNKLMKQKLNDFPLAKNWLASQQFSKSQNNLTPL